MPRKDVWSVGFLTVTLLELLCTCRAEQDANVPAGHLKPLGSHRPPEGDVEVLDHVPHPIDFYEQFVKPGKPVLLRGATKHSRAFQRWNDAYLAETYGTLVMMTEHGKKENRSLGTSYVQLKTFLARYNNSDEYMVETLPPRMHDDFELLSCLLCGGFTQNLRDAVLWFSSGGTKSVLHSDEVDNINCLMSGSKDIFLVDKKYKDMAHIDVPQGGYSSVDVDQVDVHKYPGLGKVPWWRGHMEAGDCFYIPFRWFHQLGSFGRNLAINIWWVPVRKFNESDCYEEVNGEKRRKSLAKYASLSLYGFSPGEHNRHVLMEEVQSDPKMSKGISRKMLTRLGRDSVGRDSAMPTGWKEALEKIFDVSDRDSDGYLNTTEILEIPSKLLVAVMGESQESPSQEDVQVDDNYAREHGLEPDELDDGPSEDTGNEFEEAEDGSLQEASSLPEDDLPLEEESEFDGNGVDYGEEMNGDADPDHHDDSTSHTEL